MGIKLKDLKKFKVAELKSIIKKHSLGTVSKLKKIQLIGKITSCENCNTILSSLVLPIRIRKAPSAKQLIARQKFKDMRKKTKKQLPKRSIEKIEEIKKVEKLGSVIEDIIVSIPKQPIELLKKLELTDDIPKKLSKHKFLNSIFGEKDPFNFHKTMRKVIEEVDDEKFEKFMKLSKQEKRDLLLNSHNNSMSLIKLISLI